MTSPQLELIRNLGKDPDVGYKLQLPYSSNGITAMTIEITWSGAERLVREGTHKMIRCENGEYYLLTPIQAPRLDIVYQYGMANA